MEAQARVLAPKMSGLAVTAFVLACSFFLPVVPLVGTILGIVAVATLRPDRGGKGLAIAAIPVGLVMVFFIQGILAAVAIPTFISYTRKAKAVEATESLSKIVAGARSHFQVDRYAPATGVLLPHRFPVAKTDWVPRTPCCERPDHKCLSTEAEWSGEPWRSLRFQMLDAHYFQYRYSSDGGEVTIEARADLDCDGKYSSYQYVGSGAEGSAPDFRGPIIDHPTE